jgi:hypothetical protein
MTRSRESFGIGILQVLHVELSIFKLYKLNKKVVSAIWSQNGVMGRKKSRQRGFQKTKQIMTKVTLILIQNTKINTT